MITLLRSKQIWGGASLETFSGESQLKKSPCTRREQTRVRSSKWIFFFPFSESHWHNQFRIILLPKHWTVFIWHWNDTYVSPIHRFHRLQSINQDRVDFSCRVLLPIEGGELDQTVLDGRLLERASWMDISNKIHWRSTLWRWSSRRVRSLDTRLLWW